MAKKLITAVSNKPGATPVTVIDSEPSTTGYRLMGQDLGSPTLERQYAGMRGTQGAVVAGATVQNRIAVFHLQVVGTSRDDMEAKLSVLWQLDDDLRRYGGTVTWRSEGSSYRMYMTALDSAIQIAGFDRVWEFNNRITVDWAVTAPPYLLGDPLDVLDEFTTDTEGNYTFDAGSAADVSVDVPNHVLTASANLTAEKRMIHTDRGYNYGDHQVTLKGTPGSTITSYKAGAVLKRIDAANYVEVYVDDNGTNSRLRIDKVVASARTNLATTNLAARVANGVPFWVRGRLEGHIVYAEHFTAAPSPMATPTTSTSYVLATGAEQTAFGPNAVGKAGLSWVPQQAAALLDDFDLQAYVYRNVVHPQESMPLYGPIPGDAPALANFDCAVAPSDPGPNFALVAWWNRLGKTNMLTNGSFENYVGLEGQWNGSAVTNIQGGGTAFTTVADTGLFGIRALQLTTPATADTGGNTRMYRRFKKGITYTAECWVRAVSAVTNVYIRIGNSAANDKASSANTALSTTRQKLTVTWTPAADYDDAHVAISVAAATATVFLVDAVVVYEGTTPPAQTEGRAGFQPYGLIEGENVQTGSPTANANLRGGLGYQGSAFKVPIDPSLAVQDEYTKDELAIEVWARLEIATAIAVNARVSAVSLATPGSPDIYTDEFGFGGVDLVAPTNTARRFYRLGTLRLSTRARYSLKVTLNYSGSTPYLDYVILVPPAQRALTPTGMVQDGNYPAFFPVASLAYEQLRRILPDLAGQIGTPSEQYAATSGLGGALLELPPGSVDTMVKFSEEVPNDPSSDAETEILTHTLSIHWGITPRWHLARST